MDPAKATNVFELRAEIERLEHELARARKREAELEKLVRLSEPLAGETRLFVETKLLESELGAARKLDHVLAYTAARENEGYAAFSDRERGRRTGVDRRSARDTRVALVKLGLWEQTDYVAATGVFTHRVRSAAEAWQRIKRQPVSGDPQKLLGAWAEQAGYPDLQVTEQPVESVDSPGRQVAGDASRTAPEARSESAAAGDAPPRTLSLVEEARRLMAAQRSEGVNDREGEDPARGKPPPAGQANDRLGVSCAENPHLPGDGEGFARRKPPPAGQANDRLGVFCAENPHPPPCPDDRETPPQHSARAPDTFKEPRDVPSKSVSAKKLSESVPCPSVRGAQDPLARQTSATVAALAAELLDDGRQRQTAIEISRLIPVLIRMGGQAKDGGRMSATPARKIAAAVVAGWLDWEDDVLRVYDAACAKVLRGETPAPFVYMLGTFKKIFAERERAWSRPKATTPKPKPR